MVRSLKIKKDKGEKVRAFLSKKGWLDRDRIIGRTTRELIIPLTDAAKRPELVKIGQLIERNLPKVKAKKVKTLKEALRGTIPLSKIDEINNAMDVVGDIAILEIPDSLTKVEKSIAWTIKRMLPHLKTIAKKSKRTAGKFRIRKIVPLVGARKSETLAKESGILLKVDLNKMYYSSRMGSERLRILCQVKNGEKILVMFAGIGPYSILFAKNKNVMVWSNEWNPDAVEFMKENVRMNKVRDKVIVVPGDAHRVIPKLNQRFDRICMILPGSNHEFIREACLSSKKGTVIHFYQFVNEKDFRKRGKELVELFKGAGKKVAVKKIVKSGYYSPYIYRVCYDLVMQ